MATRSTSTVVYAYDAAGRLATATYPDGTAVSYAVGAATPVPVAPVAAPMPVGAPAPVVAPAPAVAPAPVAAPVPPPPAAGPAFCAFCGAPRSPGSRFCSRCGKSGG